MVTPDDPLGVPAELATYEVLAEEYYDSDAHPTCDNLNRLSRTFLNNAVPDSIPCNEILEVGAGDSTVAAILHARGRSLAGLELQDASPRMLEHSRRWGAMGANLVVAEAHRIARPDSSVSLLVSSLGDGYNTRKYWLEAARVVRPGGRAVFTLPSSQWAMRFRNGRRAGDAPQVAEFQLRDGRRICVPSFVFPLAEQVQMIESAAFMLTRLESFGAETLERRSWKVDVFGSDPSSLVYGFTAVRLHGSPSLTFRQSPEELASTSVPRRLSE